MFPIWNFPLSVYRFRRSRSYTHICLCNLKETTKIKLVERKILQYQILKSYSFNQYTVIGSRSAHFLYFIFLSHYLGNKSGDWSKRTKLLFTLFPNFFLIRSSWPQGACWFFFFWFFFVTFFGLFLIFRGRGDGHVYLFLLSRLKY